MNEKQRKLIELLKEMFQLNQTDLDFGIYRIMNQKAEEINQFLEKDLIKYIKEAFSSNNNDSLQKELDDKISSFKNDGFTDQQIEDNQKIKELKEKLVDSSTKEKDENEVYSNLTNFFSRYYKDGDFISLRRYKKDTYAIPYEGEEVKLHWANSDQYYIKTSEYFRDYTFVVKNKKFHFKIIDADTEKNNNKADSDKERRFVIDIENPIYEENGEVYFRFEYKPVGKETQKKIDEKTIETILCCDETLIGLLKELSPTESNKNRTILEKHLTDYTSRNSFDYFIHKDLKGFLSRELDFYIKNELLYVNDILESSTFKIERSLNKWKTFKKIGDKIIAFLSQLEDFQKKLWLKKKFVVDTNYCITLDKIDEHLYSTILENKEQLKEWKEFFGVNVNSIEDLKAEKFLVLDTKFFDSDFKDTLLNEFDDLDEQCDGVLINSENFGALNLLQERYKEQVKTVYIDPPYNTGDDGFLYKDNYQHSAWASFISDRIQFIESLMRKDSVFFASIDDNESHNLKFILNSIFNQNLLSEIYYERSGSAGLGQGGDFLVNTSEMIYSYAKNRQLLDTYELSDYKQLEKKVMERYKHVLVDEGRKELVYEFESKSNKEKIRIYKHHDYKTEIISLRDFNKNEELIRKEYYEKFDKIYRTTNPQQENNFQQEIINSFEDNGLYTMNYIPSRGKNKGIETDIYYINREIFAWLKASAIKKDGEVIKTNKLTDFWAHADIPKADLANEGGVELKRGKKPEQLLKRLILSVSSKNDLIVDTFSGSGTTLAVAKKLDRKFLGIEMGEYFSSKTLPRIKNVLFGDSTGISKSVNFIGGGMFKYFKLESYEDTLNNLAFKEPNKTLFDDHVKEDYLLNYMLNYETNESLLNIDSFKNPYEYKLRIASASAGETIETNVDLAETFNYLVGLKVKYRQKTEDFLTIEGENLKEEKILIIWRNGQSNDELNEFFIKQNYSGYNREFDTIYVNGDNNLANLKKEEERFKVKLIEEEFKLRMFGE